MAPPMPLALDTPAGVPNWVRGRGDGRLPAARRALPARGAAIDGKEEWQWAAEDVGETPANWPRHGQEAPCCPRRGHAEPIYVKPERAGVAASALLASMSSVPPWFPVGDAPKGPARRDGGGGREGRGKRGENGDTKTKAARRRR